jgi:hypothetical protein
MTKSEFMGALEALAERASKSDNNEVKFSSVVLFTIGGCLCMGEGFLFPLLEASEKVCFTNLQAVDRHELDDAFYRS